MSENIQSIANGSFVLGQTSATNFVAGPGIKIDEPSAGTVRIGTDETVLWSGTGASSLNVSENLSSFETVKIYGYPAEQGTTYKHIFEFPGENTLFDFNINDFNDAGVGLVNYYTRYNLNGLTLAVTTVFHKWAWTGSFNSWEGPGNSPILVDKVIGINRISGSNTQEV